MLQISQSRKESLQRTFVNLVMAESNIVNHMEITFIQSTVFNRTMKKTVFVFTGYEYTVKFYNDTTGYRETRTGLITSINGDNNCPGNQYFVMKCLPDKPDVSPPPIPPEGMPICGCVLNTVPNSKYQDMIIVEVPVKNILDMIYTNGTPIIPRIGVKTVLLGILADVVKAVTINLKLLNDNCDNAVKEINMKIGNVYTITYFNSKDCTIYEFDGKLISIEEISEPSSMDTVVRQYEKVGLADSVYTTECGCPPTDRDIFLSEACPTKKDVKLVFDTSEDFSGTYEEIRLSWIRDCTEHTVETPVDPTPETPVTNVVQDPLCCSCNTVVEIENNKIKATVNTVDKTISYVSKDQSIENGSIGIEEVINFYLGI